jgi:DNA-binding NarL/FixJ family response regulator
MKRVYIVEHSVLVRNRICEALAGLGQFQVVGEAEASNDAVAGIDDLDPDIVITDLLLRNGTGIDLVKRVRARHGEQRPLIYVLTNHATPTYRSALAAAGANGFFDKTQGYAPLLDELRHVA